MAEENTQPQQQIGSEEGLKYLGFVEVAALHALMRFSILYAYAKQHAGPLKTGVETVEGTVKSVVQPVYNKFHDVPVQLLKFVDRKVGESLVELDRHVPTNIKKASSQAISVAQMAPETARTVVSEVRRAGVVDTASGLAKSVYSRYEPKAEQCAVSAWQRLNKLPLFPRVANVVIPPAAFCTDKYNQTVVYSAEKGYRVSSYLPLVPTDKIARMFEIKA